MIDKLWFGVDGIVRFGAGQGTSQFLWGLSPMVGYKFTDNFSAGPRISFQNGITNFGDVGIVGAGDVTLNTIDIGGGLWTRHKILGQYFIHAEVEVLSEEFATQDGFGNVSLDASNNIVTERDSNVRYYLGGGYTSQFSDAFGFTAYVLWDFSEDFGGGNIPIVTRFGLTYNF